MSESTAPDSLHTIEDAAERMLAECPCCLGALVRIGPTTGDWYAAAIQGNEELHRARGQALRAGITAGWASTVSLLRCGACGFLQVASMPTMETLLQFYSHYHRSDGYAAKGKRKIRRATKRIAGFAKQAPGHRFLDIGCNVGFAAEAARRLGFQVTGLDLDEDALTIARQSFPMVRFTSKSLEALAGNGELFDAVFCADVIEHVSDPLAFLRAVHAVTVPGGVLYLATPDAGHWRVPRPIWTWEEIRPPEHLCWFTKPALAALLKRAGFAEARAGFRLKPGLRMTAIRANAC